jgi:hypothetical protein
MSGLSDRFEHMLKEASLQVVAGTSEVGCQGALTNPSGQPYSAVVARKPAVQLNLEVRANVDDPLVVIGDIVDASRGVESMLRRWVQVARSNCHTLQEIADALRVTRQAAWERFRDVD